MAVRVLRRAVVLLLVDERERAALARVGGVEGARVELDAFGEDLDDREAVVLGGPHDHLGHVIDLRRMTARDERRPAVDQLAHRIDRLVEGAGRVGLRLEADRRRRRRLLLGQTVDEVVHDHVGQPHVLAGDVIEVVAADGEPVAVAAEDEDVEVIAPEADAGGERQGAAVDVVAAVAVDEVGEARRATDARHRDDLLVRVIEFFEGAVVAGEDGEVAAARAPRRVVGGQGLLGERGAIGRRGGGRERAGGGHGRGGTRGERAGGGVAGIRPWRRRSGVG